MGLEEISAWQLALIFILLVWALVVAFLRPVDSNSTAGPGERDAEKGSGEEDAESPPRSASQ